LQGACSKKQQECRVGTASTATP